MGLCSDPAEWEAALSSRSAPFARPANGKVDVKIITNDGGEMTMVMEVGNDA